jgi:hypothetical protein
MFFEIFTSASGKILIKNDFFYVICYSLKALIFLYLEIFLHKPQDSGKNINVLLSFTFSNKPS